MPRPQRFRPDNRGDLYEDSPAELLRFRCKPSSLIVSKSKTSTADLLPRDAIFLNQIFNDLLLAFGSANQRGKGREMKMDSDAVASVQPTMPGSHVVCSAERESSFWTLGECVELLLRAGDDEWVCWNADYDISAMLKFLPVHTARRGGFSAECHTMHCT